MKLKKDFLEVDVQHPENLHKLHNDLHFLPERMKTEKIEQPAANLHDQTGYNIQMTNLKEALNHELTLKKDNGVIKFNRKAWLKPYIDMNAELRKIAKYDFQKDLFKYKIFFNNVVFRKTMETFSKHRDIKLVATEKKRNYLVLIYRSYLSYCKVFHKTFVGYINKNNAYICE